MLMLEDGEIDGEEELNSPQQQQQHSGKIDDSEAVEVSSESRRSKKSKRHNRDRHQEAAESLSDHEELNGLGQKRKSKSNTMGGNKRNKVHYPLIADEDMYATNLDNEEINDGGGEDIDERYVTSPNSVLSYPASIALNHEQINIAANLHLPTASLLDLFKSSPGFFNADPVITEKENSRPVKKKTLLSLPLTQGFSSEGGGGVVNGGQANQIGGGDKRRKVLLQTPAEADMTVSVESIEKKLEKKIKYTEIAKEKAKKAAEREKTVAATQPPDNLRTVMCHFFLEGRCTKGDKCPFKHSDSPNSSQLNAPVDNRKLEICKFYLNSFCAKGDKCTFMHSDFPCKFFHKQSGMCTAGSSCRFSHSPITDPLLLESFERYIKETGGGSSSLEHLPNPTPPVKVPLLGPPSSQQQLAAGLIDSTSTLLKPSGNKKAPLLPPPTSVSAAKPVFQDVDERIIPLSRDIDERATALPKSHVSPLQPLLGSPPSTVAAAIVTAPLPPLQPVYSPEEFLESKYETVKKELIIKIMKAVADDDGGIFSQIPKQTLTDLLVKLLNSNVHSAELGLETIVALLATITAAGASSSLTRPEVSQDNDLRIQQQPKKSANVPGEKEEDDEDEYRFHMDFTRNSDSDEQVIDAMVDEIPYHLYDIDIEPSKLWTTMAKMHPNHYLDSTNSDQEIDPRIKYYSNRANLHNVSNFHNQLLQKEQQEAAVASVTAPAQPVSQQAPTSPNSTKNSIVKPSGKVADPRLLKASANHQSSPNSDGDNHNGISSQITSNASKSDLLAMQTKQLNNSLLSSLPDINLDLQKSFNTLLNSNTNNTVSSSSNSANGNINNNNSTVKLSIADYKRKLQKPSNGSGANFSENGIGNSATSNFSSNNGGTVSSEASSSSIVSSLPAIPAYTFNLQAPQSLHELLKNFQS